MQRDLPDWSAHWKIAIPYATKEQKEAVLGSIVSEAMEKIFGAMMALKIDEDVAMNNVTTIRPDNRKQNHYIGLGLISDTMGIDKVLLSELARLQLENAKLKQELETLKTPE